MRHAAHARKELFYAIEAMSASRHSRDINTLLPRLIGVDFLCRHGAYDIINYRDDDFSSLIAAAQLLRRHTIRRRGAQLLRHEAQRRRHVTSTAKITHRQRAYEICVIWH